MNNPIALVVLFFAIVTVWFCFIVLILAFLKGASVGEDTEAAHRDDPAWTPSR